MSAVSLIKQFKFERMVSYLCPLCRLAGYKNKDISRKEAKSAKNLYRSDPVIDDFYDFPNFRFGQILMIRQIKTVRVYQGGVF